MELGENSINRNRPQADALRGFDWRQWISDLWHSEPRFEWGIVAFAIGIALYFAWPTEPDIWICAALIGTLFVFRSILRRGGYGIGAISLFVYAVMGFFWSALHTAFEAAPRLPAYERFYTVTGWVEALERSGDDGYRWRIRVESLGDLTPEDTPERVRIRTKTLDIKPGDGVRLDAILAAPPGPAIAGGYDPSKRAYFEKVGGFGFAVSDPQRIDVASSSKAEKAARALVRYRANLAERIMTRAPPKTAGLQAALLTGERAFVPNTQTQALRASGLAHVLAISGLHMGLLAGSAFFLATLGLACIEPLARRTDVRKYGAVIGAVVATAYLLLSGASVSTQRAYIMALIVFLAVILDRRAFSMRAVALAAAVTLGLHPESLVSAGFQMSFAAAAALVAVYQNYSSRAQTLGRPSFIVRAWRSFMGIGITSLVAGAATGGFAAMIFHRVARYGFFANLAAMPIFTFIVMPAAFLSFVLMPFGFEHAPLWLMGKGLDGVLAIATWTEQVPGAIAYLPAAPQWALGLFGLGFAGLCLGPRFARIIGMLIIGASITAWAVQDTPDIRVSDQGKVAFWAPTAAGTLFVDKTRTDGYGRETFISRAGVSNPDLQSYVDSRAVCDAYVCRLELKGVQVSIITHPEAVPEACATSDLVILTERQSGVRARRACKVPLIDGRVLSQKGAQSLYLQQKGEIRSESARSRKYARRPWASE